MSKFRPDYKNAFRILKGGKISLVVSALLVGLAPTASHAINEISSTVDLNVPTGSNIVWNLGETSNGADDDSFTADYGDGQDHYISVDNDPSGWYQNAALYVFNDNTMREFDLTLNTSVSIDNDNDYEIDNDTVNFSRTSGVEIQNHILSNSSVVNNGTIDVDSYTYSSDADSYKSYARADFISDTAMGINVGEDTFYGEDTSIGINIGLIQNNDTINVNSNARIDEVSSDFVDNEPGEINKAESFATAMGIHVDYNEGDIINKDVINVTADAEIQSSWGYNSDTWDITINADALAAGINVAGGDADNTIINDGTIDVNAEAGAFDYVSHARQNYGGGTYTDDVDTEAHADAYGIRFAVNYDRIYGGEDGDNTDFEGTIINNGIITVESTLDAENTTGYATGIYVGGNVTQDGTISNTNTIIATTNAERGGVYGIQVVGDNNGTISNSGTINLTGNYVEAEGIETYANYGTIISNNITATGADDVQGIEVDGVNEGNITSYGSMTLTATDSDAYSYGIETDENYGSIKNTGVMSITADGSSADVIGIYTGSNYGHIENNNTMTLTSGNYASGIEVSGSNYANASILNSGTISVTGYDDAYGILVTGGNYAASITNSGTIDVNTTYGVGYGIYVQGDNLNGNISSKNMTVTVNGLYDATGIEVGYNSGSIVTEGNMTVSSAGEDAYGINVDDTNAGHVTNAATGSMVVTGEDMAQGIHVAGTNTGNIANLGDMNITSTTTYVDWSTGANGINVSGGNEGNITSNNMTVTAYSEAEGIDADYNAEGATITNTGTMTVTSYDDDAFGINIDDGSNNGTINNTGTINVTSYDKYATGIKVVSENGGTISSNALNVLVESDDLSNLDPHATGIYVGEDNIGSITSNNMSVTATKNVELNSSYVPYIGSGAIGIYVGEDNVGSINNTGDLNATAITGVHYNAYGEDAINMDTYAEAHGIVDDNNGSITSENINLVATATLDVDNIGEDADVLTGSYTNGITAYVNRGEITSESITMDSNTTANIDGLGEDSFVITSANADGIDTAWNEGDITSGSIVSLVTATTHIDNVDTGYWNNYDGENVYLNGGAFDNYWYNGEDAVMLTEARGTGIAVWENNDGHITSENISLAVNATTSVDATISNQSYLGEDSLVASVANASGIYVGDDNRAGSTVTSTGDIDVAAVATINVDNFYGEDTILEALSWATGIEVAGANAGDITANNITVSSIAMINFGDDADGNGEDYATASATGIFVGNDNSGSIASTGDINVYAQGDDAQGLGVYVGEDNMGSISTARINVDVNSTSAEGNAFWANAVGIAVDGDNGSSSDRSASITNSEAIVVTTQLGEATGIYLTGDNYGTITASGDINATSHGAYDAEGVDVDDNYGSITTNNMHIVSEDEYATGIEVDNDNGEDGYIASTGSMTVHSENSSAQGIAVDDYNYGTIENNGTITVTAMNSARGITVGDDDDYDNYGDILNNDTINVYSENSQAYGIEVEGYNYGRIITKDMDVESNGTSYAVGIEVEYDNGEDGYNPNEVGYIENTGTMTVTAHNSDAYGIFSEENDDNYGIIKNSGTITVTSDTDNAYGILFGDNYRDIINDTESSITVTADEDAYGIYVSGDNDGTTEDNAQIINRGKITVASIAGDIVNSESTAAGIYVGGDNYDDGIISNDGGDINVTSNKEGTEVFGIFVDAENDGDIENINGATITATSTADNAYGIFIYDDNDGTIENDGAITAAAADGYNAYGIYIGNDEWNSDGEIIISEDGSITATIINDEGEHVADHAAYSIWMSDAGDHLVTNNGVLSGNIKVYNELTNSGNIILPWNANYNDSNYAYIEDLTVTDGGILTIGLYNTADNGSDLDVSYSQLSTYTSTFEDGATIHVDVQSDAAHQLLIDGETLYEVVYGSRGLTAEDGSSVNVDLETLNVTDNSDLLDFTAWTDGNQYGDGILNLNASVNAIDGTNALLSAQVGIAQMNNAILNDTRKRIVQVSDNASDANGTNSGDVVAGSNGFWLKPFYAYGNQAAKDGITGFDMDSYGIGVGFDNQVGQNSRFGLGFYYTNADIQVQDNMAQVDAENFTVVAYGSTALNEAKTTKFIYQLGYSSQNNDARRTIDSVDTRAVNGMADIFSEYDSSVASLDLGIMGEYKMSQGTTANPLIEARLRRFETSDFTESSAQTDATYSIDQSVNYETTVAVGSMFETKMSEDSKFVTDLRVGYDFSHDDGVIHAQYAVDAFGAYAQDIATIDNGGLVYNVGAMYQTEGDNVVFDLSYDLEGRGADFQNHMFSAKAVFKF